jgi:hypothetical protein
MIQVAFPEPLPSAKCHLVFRTTKSPKNIVCIFSPFTDIDMKDELMTCINFIGGGANVCHFSIMSGREVPFNSLSFSGFLRSRNVSPNFID